MHCSWEAIIYGFVSTNGALVLYLVELKIAIWLLSTTNKNTPKNGDIDSHSHYCDDTVSLIFFQMIHAINLEIHNYFHIIFHIVQVANCEW